MNVLFYRYNSICEPSFLYTFKKAGLNVIEETTEIYKKKLPPSKMIENVQSILSKDNFAFVFSINFFPTLSAICNIFKIPYVCVIVDSPVLELYSDELLNPYNRIFIFDRDLYNIFHKRNPDCVFHLPLAGDVDNFGRAILEAPDNLNHKFNHDISFIGSLYSEKCAYNKTTFSPYTKGYIDALIEAQIGIYGYNFIYDALSDEMTDRILSENKFYTFPEKSHGDYKAIVAEEIIGVKTAEQDRIRTLRYLSEDCGFNVDVYTGSDTSMLPKIHNRGFAKSLTEMPLIFNRSKINLNITARTIHTGLSQRVFDVLACGGFLITNYQAELEEFFTIGKELETYSSKEELREKISFYLEHDDARSQIALNGYDAICSRHSMDIRFNEILKLAFEKGK